MTYRFDGRDWLVKFEKGDFLIEGLTEFVKKETIKGAWISGLGGTLWAELGYYDLENQQYIWRTFDDIPEIISLQGNIGWKDDAPLLHIHGTFSKADFTAIGGHVKELAVGGTCEVLVHKWREESGLSRSFDERTGLTLLNV